MSLAEVTLDLNDRLVQRLYDERGGYYLLMTLVSWVFIPDRALSRAEALTFYCSSKQVLRHVYPGQNVPLFQGG